MKRIVYVIEVNVPDDHRDSEMSMMDKFGPGLYGWMTYFPLEDNAPIRVNISYDGVEEV